MLIIYVSQINRCLLNDNYDFWLKTEFDQNYSQLRDADSKIIDLVKFYFTIFIGAITVYFGLISKTSDHNEMYVGGFALFLALGIIGYIIAHWLVRLRGYFTIYARQLNAIRKQFTLSFSPEMSDVFLHSKDVKKPDVLHKDSSHIAALYTIIIGILISILVAMLLITRLLEVEPYLKISISILITVLLGGIIIYRFFKNIKRRANE